MMFTKKISTVSYDFFFLVQSQMIDDILHIHESVEKNKKYREPYIYLLKKGELSPYDFINQTYESFDCIGQSKLLLLKCKSHDITLNSVAFISKLKRPATAPVKRQENTLNFTTNRPQTPHTRKQIASQKSTVYDRLYTPRKKCKKQEFELGSNKNVAYMNSLRS